MKIRRTMLRPFFTVAALLLVPTAPVSAQSLIQRAGRTPSLIVQLQPNTNIAQVAAQYGFTVSKPVNSNTGAPTYVIRGNNLDTLKLALGASGSVRWVSDNKSVRVVPLDGGETVLPLDGGETVLPLDGGETVLPLGPGFPVVTTATINIALNSVLKTLDGGETVLPLDGGTTFLTMRQLKAAYAKIAALHVGSPALILQPAFARIGFFAAVLKTTGKGIVIADLDTGADTCHPALTGIFTYNFVADEPIAPEDCPVNGVVPGPGFGHGTEVASLLRTLAPEATVWSLRIFDSTGQADVATVYEGVVWAVDHGAKIINMSFGATDDSDALLDAVAYAAAHNVLLTGAAGNSDQNAVLYPAAIQPTLAVAAVDLSDRKASFSNYNYSIDVSAPGSNLVAAYPGNRWAIVWGTSFAAPIVAAEGALTWEAWSSRYNVSLNPAYLRLVLKSAIDNLYPVNPLYLGKLGTGRINMWKAYRAIVPFSPTTR